MDFIGEVWPRSTTVKKEPLDLKLSKELKANVIDFSAGAIGGVAGLFVGHPFDTVKTVTQSSSKRMAITEGFNGIGQHGYKTFYRGLSVPFWSYAGTNACIFLSFKFAQRNLDPGETSIVASAACGAFAGLCQLIPATPVEVIKIHMQRDTLRIQQVTTCGPMHYVRSIIKSEGMFGLYKGFTIQAMRDTPSFTMYFFSYTLTNRMLDEYNIIKNDLFRTFVSGGIGGMMSWVSFIPLDVMKTRIQGGVDANIKESYKALQNIGFESFFRGGSMLAIRALLVNAITFVFYEKCAQIMNEM